MLGVRSPAERHFGRASPSMLSSWFKDFTVEGLRRLLDHAIDRLCLDHLDPLGEQIERGTTGGLLI